MRTAIATIILVLLAAVAVLAQEAPLLDDPFAGVSLSESGNLALVLSSVPGYPDRDNSAIEWVQPGADLPADPGTPDKDAQTALWRVTSVALYNHSVSGFDLPSSGLRVYLYSGDSPDRNLFHAVGYADCNQYGSFAIDALASRYCELRFFLRNEALTPAWPDGLPNWAWWYTGTFVLPDSGGLADIGYCRPITELQNGLAHVAASFWRLRWMFYYVTGGDIVAPITQQLQPVNTGTAPAYMDDDKVCISVDNLWRDDVLAAQYARLWMKQFCPTWADGCGRGIDGDPTPDACPEWCDSDAWVAAYTQGLSRWFGDIIQELYPFYFGYTAVPARDHDTPLSCDAGANDPELTAGLFTAALRDIQDLYPDSHGIFGDYTDRLALGYDEIIATAKAGAYSGSPPFLRALGQAYPQHMAALWETAMNCGLSIDIPAPGAVVNLVSSHTVGTPSPDATIAFSWTTPADDASGVAGYSVLVSANGAAPDQVQDLGAVTSFTTNFLTPGTWYFAIRAVDRAGRWSTDVVTAGPYTILPGEPADLEPYARTGWAYPVVPSTLGNANANSCPAPTTLVGGGAPLYFNTCGTNTGGSVTSDKFGVRCLVDGQDWGITWGHNGGDPGRGLLDPQPARARGGRRPPHLRELPRLQ